MSNAPLKPSEAIVHLVMSTDLLGRIEAQRLDTYSKNPGSRIPARSTLLREAISLGLRVMEDRAALKALGEKY